MAKNIRLNLRKLHRKIAPLLFLPLLMSALTGIGYRIGRTWLGLNNEFGDFMMALHQGEYLGKSLVPVYVLLNGVGLIAMLITGIAGIKQNRTSSIKNKFSNRFWHRSLAPFLFLPLILSALTGIAYRLGKAWFSLSKEQAKLLLDIHQGSYLGSTWRAIYILLVGCGLIAMLATGIKMTTIFKPFPEPKTK